MLELDTIHCGDNIDLLTQLPDGCIDLVVTSPPYDNLRVYGGHTWDFEGVAQGLTRVLKPGGVVVWVVADATVNGSETLTSMRQAIYFKDVCGLNVHDTMIYMKDAPQFPDANRYGQVWEFAFVLSAGMPKTKNMICDRKNVSYGRTVTGTDRQADGTTKKASCFGQDIKEFGQRFNVWQYATTKGNSETAHPAPFPQKLASDHIASWSNPGDLVLDPFSGSGTTAKAAKELGRRYLGLEINADYCEIARKRLSQQVLDF